MLIYVSLPTFFHWNIRGNPHQQREWFSSIESCCVLCPAYCVLKHATKIHFFFFYVLFCLCLILYDDVYCGACVGITFFVLYSNAMAQDSFIYIVEVNPINKIWHMSFWISATTFGLQNCWTFFLGWMCVYVSCRQNRKNEVF